jgi:hypothetical protein
MEYSLNANQIGDAGAIAIAEALFGNTTLSYLGYVFLKKKKKHMS